MSIPLFGCCTDIDTIMIILNAIFFYLCINSNIFFSNAKFICLLWVIFFIRNWNSTTVKITETGVSNQKLLLNLSQKITLLNKWSCIKIKLYHDKSIIISFKQVYLSRHIDIWYAYARKGGYANNCVMKYEIGGWGFGRSGRSTYIIWVRRSMCRN
jgi:hypothetical protein